MLDGAVIVHFSEMVSEARRKINKVLSTVITLVALVRWCSCSPSCSQLINNENNTTNKSGIKGIPVFHGNIIASQTELKIWYTTMTYMLQCCTTANPGPQIIWYKNGNIYTFRTNRRAVVNNGGQSVSLNDIRMSDAGNYTCVAKNAYGNVSHSFLVKVRSTFKLQKPVVMLQPSPWTTVVGSNITISCTIMQSTIRPTVDWLHDIKNNTKLCIGDRYLNDEPSETQDKQVWLSKLTILNVTVDDEGNYTCIAKNGAGSGKPAQQKGSLILLLARDKKPQTPGNQEEKSWLIKNPLVVGSMTLVGVSVLVLILLIYLWKMKKSRSHCVARFPIHDQQSFSKHESSFDNNPLLLHEGEMHIEIPRENLQLLKRGHGADQDNDYDVFLSYSSLDRDFVKNCLYSELTSTHSVCIDFKDFEAGLFITDNIANSVFRSRKTILVVTRNFLKGVWTFFEMQLAQGRLSEGHDVLILVVVEEIPVDELPRPLQHYRKMKTYLEYYNEDVKPHFWDRLRSAIGPSLGEGNQVLSITAEKDERV